MEKLRRYGGNAILGEDEANAVVDAFDGLEEQLEVARDAERLADRRYFAEIKNYEQAEQRAERLQEQNEAAMDCLNYAWTIICNVSEGDWTKQTQEWQDAAARCRDQYHALLPTMGPEE